MANLGAAVSRKSWDVKNSADKFKIFSSAFQTLKIHSVQSVSTTIPASGGADNTITVTHNLGYLAPFIVVYNGSTTIGQNTSYFFSDSDGASMGQEYYDNCRNTTTALTITITDYWDEVNSANGDTVYFTVYFFLDDFRTVTPDTINTEVTSGSSGDNYGIRVSKDGKDVITGDDVDMILSSSFFTQIVHKKGYETATGDGLYYVAQDLTYVPATLAYYQYDGETGINYHRVNIEDNQIGTYLYTGDTLYYIIFKNQIV